MNFDSLMLEDLQIQLIDGDRGKNYPKQSEFQEKGHCLFLSAKNVTKTGFQFAEKVYIPENLHNRLRSGKLERNDIVLTTRGTIGNVAFYDDSIDDDIVRVNSGMLILRSEPSIWNPRFLYFLFTSRIVQEQIASLTSGSAVPQLPAKDLKKFSLPKVPLEVQSYIVKIIGDLSDKLAINTQTNQTLEEMAQAIFKSWFVDFDPVKAKMNGEQPEGMDAATASLFPEKLVESELGLIPEGWEVKPLDKIAHFENGLALQKFRPESEDDDFLPVLKIAQLRQGYCDGKEKARTDIKESCRVYNGDMIFSWSGTLMIDLWTGGKAALNQHLFKVTSKDYTLPLYLYWTKHHLVKFQQIAKDKAVTMGHIKRGHLSESLCVVPPKDLRDKMDEILMPLINQGLNMRLQSNQLATLRDTLLPKLLSGEIELDVLGDNAND